ncbi:MAG: sigma-70 family RNA polymerase sigma factor [Planctomycetes bacterium]|nr:sigma-70 family RNA polymerase sigma factor [Planctomycetota bacterium]
MANWEAMAVTADQAVAEVREEDWALLHAFARGGEDGERAFGQLVRRHGPMVLGICRRRLHDADAAEDATQAVFVLLARKAGGLRTKSSLSGWLYRTAELVTRTMVRSRRNRTRHEGRAAGAHRIEADADGARDLALLRERLQEGLALLKERDREAIVVHYLEGVAQDQAAARLGIGHDAFRQRLSRALERLRGVLGTQGAVFTVTGLDAGLARLGQADAQAWQEPLRRSCSEAASGSGGLSLSVAGIVKGAMRSMIARKLMLLAGWCAVACFGGALGWSGESRPVPPAQSAVAAVKIQDASPKAGPALSEALAATHVNLPQVKAVGAPVFSPDGRWLAAQEEDGGLVLIDVAQALKDGNAMQPKRYKTAEPLKASSWGQDFIGVAASFSSDSKRMVFRGPDDVMMLDLPPTGEPRALQLGKNCIPALASAPAKATPLSGGKEHREERWAFYKVASLQQPKDPGPGVKPEVRAPRLLLYRVGGQGNDPKMEGPDVRLEGLAWNADGSALLATLKDGSSAVVDSWSGRVTSQLDIAAFEREAGKSFEQIRTVAQDGKRVLVEGQRTYPEEMRDRIGTFVPGGDETPERGRNPGSAEPGPNMPRYYYICEGEKNRKIWMASTARFLDTLLVLPATKLDRYVYFQVANDGGAGQGVPHAWLGQLDALGVRTEKDLGNPFGALADAPVFQVLAVAPDAGKALVLARSMRERKISKNFDAETMKEIQKMLPNAAHRDGKDAAIKMLAGAVLMHKYERAGCSDDGDNVILHFHTWSLWVLDAVKGEVRRVGPEFGESIGELKDVVGAPGAPERGLGDDAAYSANAGLVAVPLYGNGMKPGKFSEARGLMLLKVSAW